MILEQHQSGGLELLGFAWSWVSGEAQATSTLIGFWGNAILTHGNQDRITTTGNQDRIRTFGNQDRVGT